ncbi:MAG: hypothetical protein KAS32_26445 [Candidatus Peribacteraceae bacterium]|nr:hypothetical protein [Candidatus Peribacteraceae bacterium]
MIHESKKYDGVQESKGVVGKDEPVFLLRGTDPDALKVIQYWVRLKGGPGYTGEGKKDKLQSVIAHAEKMEEYCNKLVRKET